MAKMLDLGRSWKWLSAFLLIAFLAFFAAAQAPALLGLTEGAAWQAFARRVAGI